MPVAPGVARVAQPDDVPRRVIPPAAELPVMEMLHRSVPTQLADAP